MYYKIVFIENISCCIRIYYNIIVKINYFFTLQKSLINLLDLQAIVTSKLIECSFISNASIYYYDPDVISRVDIYILCVEKKFFGPLMLKSWLRHWRRDLPAQRS